MVLHHLFIRVTYQKHVRTSHHDLRDFLTDELQLAVVIPVSRPERARPSRLARKF
jgi:hypothetical protein